MAVLLQLLSGQLSVAATVSGEAKPPLLCAGEQFGLRPDGPFTNQYYAFKVFLFSPPAIERIRFTKPGSAYSLNGKPHAKPVPYEAALQRETFYVWERVDFADSDAPEALGRVAGVSHSEFWVVDKEGISRLRKDVEISGSNVPPLEMAYQLQSHLNDVLSFVSPVLNRATLRWSSETNFSADCFYGRGRLEGVVAGDGRRPASVSFTLSAMPGFSHRVSYAYEPKDGIPDFLPSRIVREVTTPKGAIVSSTNEIESIILGSATFGTDGYTPERFARDFPDSENSRAYFTNGNGYGYVERNGRIVELHPSEAGEGGAAILAKQERNLIATIGFMVAGVIAAMALGLYVARRHWRKR